MRERNKIDVTTSALLRIHKANALERKIYLALSTTAFVVLISVSMHAYFTGAMSAASLVPLFAATGVIGICISRILSMWRDCIQTILAVINSEAGIPNDER